MKKETVIKGLNEAVEQPKDISLVRKTNGTVRTFRGSEDMIKAKADELYDQGYLCTLHGGPVWTLTATIGAEVDEDGNIIMAEPEPSWDFTFRRETKPLLECNTLELIVDLDPIHKQTLKEWAKGNDTAMPAFDYWLDYDPDTIVADDFDYLDEQLKRAQKVYYLMADGVKDTLIDVPIVKRSVTPPEGYPLDTYYENIGKVYRTLDLITESGMPDWLADTLRTQFDDSGSVNEDSGEDPNSKYERAYGWLKHSPTVTPGSDGRISITEEYEYGLWPYKSLFNGLIGEPPAKAAA